MAYHSAANLRSATSFSQSIVELRALSHVLPQEGPPNLATFNSIYVVTASDIHLAVQSGAFENPRLVDAMATEFSNLYLEALRASEMPEPWSKATTPGLPAYIAALVSANIHINHDLPLALLQCVDRPTNFKRDYFRMERIIRQSTNRILESYARTAKHDRVPWFVRRLIQVPLAMLLVFWRRRAWRSYLLLRSGNLSRQELVAQNMRLSDRFIGAPRPFRSV